MGRLAYGLGKQGKHGSGPGLAVLRKSVIMQMEGVSIFVKVDPRVLWGETELLQESDETFASKFSIC